MVTHIDDRLLNIAHLMAKQVDGHHWQGMLISVIAHHVLRVLVLYTQILAEPERLSLQPSLLQFNEYEVFMAVILQDSSAEVYTEHRQRVALVVCVLMRPDRHLDDVLLQQGRQNGTGNALIVHQVFEYNVVNRVCNCYHNWRIFTFLFAKLQKISGTAKLLPIFFIVR